MNRRRDPGQSTGVAAIGAIDVRALAPYWPTIVVLVVAAIVRSSIWLNADVSLLLTLGERVLAGARAYVDFSETNPPASILLYLPAIFAAQHTGVTPECALTILIFAGALLCLWTVGRILSAGGLLLSREKPLLAALSLVLLLILPGDNFAEREHIALIAMLPMLAIYAVRANGMPPSANLARLSGLGAGVAVAIKPYFALPFAIALPYVVWCWTAHKQKLLTVLIWPEHLTGALVVLAYAIVLVWRFSDYLHGTLPLVLALYVPLKYSLPLMLTNPSVILVAMAAIVGLALGRKEFRTPLIAVCALAVLGFTAALIMQGKGWPYHGYPAIALSLLALSVLLIRRLFKLSDNAAQFRPLAIDLAFGTALFVCIYAAASVWLLQEPSRAKLVAEVARLAPAHPRIVAIYGGPGIAFPLTRKLHGTLIGRTPFQWISAFTDRLLAVGALDPGGGHKILDPATRRRFEEYGRLDRIELGDTIRTGQPDVVLIGDELERRWALAHPEISTALKPYREVATVDGVEIWLPRNATKAVAP